jgi:hypothetical protein
LGEKDYLWLLDGSPLDRYRHYVQVRRGRVAVFRIRYEAYIAGRRHVIVRYDTAHGFPHRDTLHPNGTEDKAEFPEADRADVLTMGEQDIKINWRKHRERYVREMKR